MTSKMLSLFPDQQEVMAQLRAAMRAFKAILLQSPTGSGKTAMALYMILKCLEKLQSDPQFRDLKIIFTVPRKDLLEQTSETLTGYGVVHSFIASGKKYNPFARVFIGMVDTMANRIVIDEDGNKVSVDLPKAYIVLIDETHFGAGSLEKVILHYKSEGCWVIGLSATPWKLNGQGLGMWYDTMVTGKSVRWLIENKRLSDYDYYYGKTKPDLSKIKVSNGDYAKGELAAYMEEQGVIIGDCVSDYIERCMGKLHIVRCASIKHSEMVSESFRLAGINAVHVDGETPMAERKRIFKAYAMREIQVLTFCDLLNFGFDLSQASGGMDVCIESGSDLKPSKSLAAQMQFWGRMLRYKPYMAIINDHVNNYLEHGLPCSDREWTLEDRKVKKKSGGENVMPTKQCPNCRCVHRVAPACTQCGYVYEIIGREIDEVDGDLHKIDKEEVRLMKRNERKQQGQAQTLDDLIKLGKQRGMTNPSGWARHVFEGRQKKVEDLIKAGREAAAGGVASYTSWLKTLDPKVKEHVRPHHAEFSKIAKDADAQPQLEIA